MKYLLPRKPLFKANLHTHSTISGGKLTPEEIKAAYKERGYSILALTDHSAMIAHNDLTDPDFLMLTGVEIDMLQTSRKTTVHLCMLSRDPLQQWIPFVDPTAEKMRPYMDLCESDDLAHTYSPENINRIIARANERGILVTYNHPSWSMEFHKDYSVYEGLWAMEYRNSTCIAGGNDENNGWVFREFLNMGKPLMPVMADDMHVIRHPRHGCPILGQSWTVVAADRLTYDCVMDALVRGDLYSSCGPEIHSLTFEDGILRITCSPATKIQLIKSCRPNRMDWGEGLTEAEFDLREWIELSQDDPDAWFYVVVTAADGTYAVTRAFRPKDLLEDE